MSTFSESAPAAALRQLRPFRDIVNVTYRGRVYRLLVTDVDADGTVWAQVDNASERDSRYSFCLNSDGTVVRHRWAVDGGTCLESKDWPNATVEIVGESPSVDPSLRIGFVAEVEVGQSVEIDGDWYRVLGVRLGSYDDDLKMSAWLTLDGHDDMRVYDRVQVRGWTNAEQTIIERLDLVEEMWGELTSGELIHDDTNPRGLTLKEEALLAMWEIAVREIETVDAEQYDVRHGDITAPYGPDNPMEPDEEIARRVAYAASMLKWGTI